MPEDYNAPATKRDVIELREHVNRLGETLTGTKRDVIVLREHVGQLGEILTEKMRDMQTEVLRAFHN